MSLPVLTAVTGAPWEADLVAGLERGSCGITVVRRCVDLADLLSVAATGTARAVLLSAQLRRLDGEALSRLAAAGVAVVGLFTPGDEAAEHRLRQLGVGHALPGDSTAVEIAAAVTSAVGGVSQEAGRSLAFADTRAALGQPLVPATGESSVECAALGRLIAVWGPTGAPGRTTIAVGVASELAVAGTSTLLADADTYGGSIAQVLGFLDEAPGLAAAARAANHGQLDLTALARLAPMGGTRLRVLTGISRPDRWMELRPAALERVWALARRLASATVVDCGFCLEQDEELSFDTAAPRRNAATLATLEQADMVLAVGAADPVGVQRLIRGLADLREALPAITPRVVLNKVRRGPVGRDPEHQLHVAMERYGGVRGPFFIPFDADGVDAAMLAGRPLADVAPESDVRRAVAAVAAALIERPPRARRRRLRRRH